MRVAVIALAAALLAGCSGAPSASPSATGGFVIGSSVGGATGRASSGPGVPAPTVSGSPPAAAPTAPKLPTVKGYTYAEAPAEVVRALGAPAGAVLGPATVRAVRRGDEAVGSVALRTVAADRAGDPDVAAALVGAVTTPLRGQGYTLRTRTMKDRSGRAVAVATAVRKGSTVLVWVYRGRLAQLVSSRPEETGLAFVTGWLASSG